MSEYLINKLNEQGFIFKVHLRNKNFVLWASCSVDRGKNRDFLTVFVRKVYLLLRPKFYGITWKSIKANNMNKEMIVKQIEEDYIELLTDAYNSKCNKDSTLAKKIVNNN